VGAAVFRPMTKAVRNGLLQPAEIAGIRAGKIFSKIFFIL
jgi:hypothetical protein